MRSKDMSSGEHSHVNEPVADFNPGETVSVCLLILHFALGHPNQAHFEQISGSELEDNLCASQNSHRSRKPAGRSSQTWPRLANRVTPEFVSVEGASGENFAGFGSLSD